MKRTILLVLPALVLSLNFLAGRSVVAAQAAEPLQKAAGSCESLKNLRLPQTTILVAELHEAGKPFVPAYTNVQVNPAADFCRVMGVVDPEIRFEVWLPAAAAWNGRFLGTASGGGGGMGSIEYRMMNSGIGMSYAIANSDAGHPWADGAFAKVRPDMLLDWTTRATHVMTLAAKWVIEAYYGQPAKYSYLTGCSGGGGQSLMEVQRFPKDYNGVVAGAPANNRTRGLPGELWTVWANLIKDPAGTLPREKVPMIHNAVVAACDLNDGVKDGVIQDPRTCKFDPATLQCKAGDAPDCLTAAQVSTLKTLYAGMKNPTTGEQYWPPYMMGSEQRWVPHHYEIARGSQAYFKFDYFGDVNWNWKKLDFSDPKTFKILDDAEAKLRPVLNATDPDLNSFKSAGGKLILYHGWADANISPINSVNYYESVVADQGSAAATQNFMRLVMIPGMGHCNGGDGATPDMADLLTAITNWVEKSQAPASIPASHKTAGKVDMTRPLCMYPQVPTYKGSGDTKDAANFTCADPKQ